MSLATGDLAGGPKPVSKGRSWTPLRGAGGLAEAWLGWLRTYQSRAEEALRARQAPPRAGGWLHTGFPNAYAQMAATMALATLGRADEALATLDALERRRRPEWARSVGCPGRSTSAAGSCATWASSRRPTS